MKSWGAANLGPYDPANLAPVAVDDAFTTKTDLPVLVRLAGNDTDPERETLVVAALTDPSHGDVVTLADKEMLYIPDFGFYGNNEFTYWVTDGEGGYATATARIEVRQR